MSLYEVLQKIEYKNWRFDQSYDFTSGMITLRAIVPTLDSRNTKPKPGEIYHVKPIHPDTLEHMHDDEIAEFVFQFICGIEAHEAGEWFRLDGRAPFDPHGETERPANIGFRPSQGYILKPTW